MGVARRPVPGKNQLATRRCPVCALNCGSDESARRFRTSNEIRLHLFHVHSDASSAVVRTEAVAKLKRQLNSKAGARVHACSKCKKTYSNSGNLRRHSKLCKEEEDRGESEESSREELDKTSNKDKFREVLKAVFPEEDRGEGEDSSREELDKTANKDKFREVLKAVFPEEDRGQGEESSREGEESSREELDKTANKDKFREVLKAVFPEEAAQSAAAPVDTKDLLKTLVEDALWPAPAASPSPSSEATKKAIDKAIESLASPPLPAAVENKAAVMQPVAASTPVDSGCLIKRVLLDSDLSSPFASREMTRKLKGVVPISPLVTSAGQECSRPPWMECPQCSQRLNSSASLWAHMRRAHAHRRSGRPEAPPGTG